MTFIKEEKEKMKLMLLKVDSIQNNIFENFIEQHLVENKFKKDNLTQFIYESSKRARSGEPSQIITRLFGTEMITREISQSIAEIINLRCEKNKVIEKLSLNSLSETYEVKKYT